MAAIIDTNKWRAPFNCSAALVSFSSLLRWISLFLQLCRWGAEFAATSVQPQFFLKLCMAGFSANFHQTFHNFFSTLHAKLRDSIMRFPKYWNFTSTAYTDDGQKFWRQSWWWWQRISGDFMTIKLGLSRVLVTTIQRQKSFISQQEVSAKAVSYFEKQRSINSWHDNCDKFHSYGSDNKFLHQFLLITGKSKDYHPLTQEELKAPLEIEVQIYHGSSNKVTSNFDCLSHLRMTDLFPKSYTYRSHIKCHMVPLPTCSIVDQWQWFHSKFDF